MSSRLPLGPFDSLLPEPLLIEVEVERGIVKGAGLRAGLSSRGISVGFEGATVDEALPLAERICSRSAIAHSVAFCQALEEIAGIEVEPGPAELRVVLAEYERIVSHLGLVSSLGRALEDDLVFRLPRRYLVLLREALSRATGGHGGFGAIVPGGVTSDVDAGTILGLEATDRALLREVSFWGKKLSLSRRRLTDARLSRESVPDGAPPSPVFRASGLPGDLRCGEGAYGGYAELQLEPVTRERGTGMDRVLVILGEIKSSLGLIAEVRERSIAATGFPGEIEFPSGNGIGVCESPEGAVEHSVFLGSEGRIIRDRIGDAGQVAAQLVPAALEGSRYEDLAVCLLSFYLCGPCIDL